MIIDACHVWQKLFELRWTESPPQIMKYVNEALRGMWHEVALGETGSLVVQNIFENCLEEDKVWYWHPHLYKPSLTNPAPLYWRSAWVYQYYCTWSVRELVHPAHLVSYLKTCATFIRQHLIVLIQWTWCAPWSYQGSWYGCSKCSRIQHGSICV